MTDRAEKLASSAHRGAEAQALLEHPLFASLFAEMAEKTIDEMLKLPVSAHDDRLALATVLRVLRGMPGAIRKVAEDGAFDARTLADLMRTQNG